MDEHVRSRLPPAADAGGLTSPATGHRAPTAHRGHPPPFPDQEDHPQAAAKARGQAAMPGLTWRNSACTDRAGNDLPQFVGGSRINTETLRNWVNKAEVDSGERPGPTTGDQKRIAELEREVRELRRANEILKAASAYFARELDPRHPR